MQRVSISGRSVAVSVAGSGVAVLFVHGFPLDRTMWDPVTDRLDGCLALAPDLCGFGESDVGTGGHSLEDHADDLTAVLDAFGIERAVVCGLSMGGYVAFELLRRHPARLAGLVLANTKAEADDAAGKAARDETIGLVEREGSGALVERMIPKLLSPYTLKDNRDLVETVGGMIRRAPAAGLAAALAAMRDRSDATGLLSAVSVPTLVVAGAQDQLTPPEGMRSMAGRIPGARFVEIPQAGHLTPLEQPDATAREVECFLQCLRVG